MSTVDPDAIRIIAVIGTGTIGASWAALFLGHGLDVIASDPASDAEARLRAFLVRALPDVRPEPPPAQGKLIFVATPEDAAAGADLVQENAPEREDLKADLIARLEAAAPPHAIIASSTTAFPQSKIAAQAKDPARVIVAHPFNPPHLVPLVELVGITPEAPAVRRALGVLQAPRPRARDLEKGGRRPSRQPAAGGRHAGGSLLPRAGHRGRRGH
jgi:carnitine 3-dehydrogenase